METSVFRWDIINHLIKKNNYKRYLEIGYYKGWSFDKVNCAYKVAVDPYPCKCAEQMEWTPSSTDGYLTKSTTSNFDVRSQNFRRELIFKCTSDEYFLGRTNMYDIIFIDGLHHSDQVLKDVRNGLRLLRNHGVIILHDCNPPTLLHVTTGVNGCWTGDTYKAAVTLNYLGLDFYTVDVDWGIGILKPKSVKKGKLRANLEKVTEWNFFCKNRKPLLNLTSYDRFLRREKI